jgi:hypothetical protein
MSDIKRSSYGHIEGISFKGLTPSAIEKIGGIGFSDVVVRRHGMEGKGQNSLEVVNKNDIFSTDKESNVVVEPDFTNANVVLNNNYSPVAPIQVESSVVLSLNGKSITGPVFMESNGDVLEGNTDSYGLWVKKGGDIVVEGNGEIIAQEAKYSMAVWADGGNVTIKGGVYRNGGNSCDLIYASNGGNVLIEGGEFFPKGPSDGSVPGTKNKYTALNVKDKDYKSGVSNIIVKGGIFHNFNPENNVSEGDNTSFVADGYKSVEISENVWEVIPE